MGDIKIIVTTENASNLLKTIELKPFISVEQK
jgi:hypothetical protein